MDCDDKIPETHKINNRYLYNLLAVQPSDSAHLTLPIDLRTPEEYKSCRIRNAINIFLSEEYGGPITSRLLESACSTSQEGLSRFQFRGITIIVLYGGSLPHTKKFLGFFVSEKKARKVFVLNGTITDFFLEYPFRCNGTLAPPDSHDIYPSQILDFLFLGSEQNATSRDQLVNLKISCVLNCASNDVPNTFSGILLHSMEPGESNKTKISYHDIPIEDDPSQDLTPFIEKATNFIEKAKKEKQNILVHCKAGKSRSVAFVVAYLMAYQNMPFKQAHGYVKLCRPNISINSGFLEQLQQLSSNT